MQKATTADTQRIDDTLAALIEEHHLPGIAVGVVRGDDLVHARGFGYADIESGRPLAPELRHRIGSITKTMLALCTLALVEEGRLSLDARVVGLLPDIRFDGPAEPLAVRHLLTHSGGIGEVPNAKDLADPFAWLFFDERTSAPVAELYADGITIEVPPGTKYAYANHGFCLLGEIVERIEKTPVAEVLRRRVFEPLGMRDTDLLDRRHPDLSTGYRHEPQAEAREFILRMNRQTGEERPVDGHNIRGNYLYVWGNGAAGAVQSTIPDMARYASALLCGGGGIVRPETFRQMVSPHWCPDPRLGGWGLGFTVRPYLGRRAFGHGGSVIGGWNSSMVVSPEDGLAVLIHTNIMYEKFESHVAAGIVQAVLGAPGGPPPAGVPIPAPALDTAPGVYEATTPGPLTNFRVATGSGRIQVSAREGGLVLHSRRGPWKEGVRLLPADPAQPDLFLLDTGEPQPPLLVTLLDGRGAVIGLRFQQLVDMYRTGRVEPWA